MDPRIASQRLDSLRRNRNPRPVTDLSADIQRVVAALQSQRKVVGGLDAAWRTEVPAELQARVAVVSLARGTLTCRAPDASSRYEFDQWARSGGLSRLAAASRLVISRCKWSH